MDDDSILQLVGLGISLFLTACFSAVEALFERLSKDEIINAIEQGGKKADRVTTWLKNPRRYVITLVVAKSGLLVTAVVCMLQLIPPLMGNTVPMRLLAWVGAILMVVLFAEIIPRNYIRGSNDSSLVVAVYFLQMAYLVLFLVVKPLDWLGRVGTRLLGRPLASEEHPLVSLEDLDALVKLGDSEEIFEQEERDMIDRILELPDTVAREIMIPRTDMVCLEINTPMEGVLEVAIESRHSRLPIYDGGIDNIIGILHVKDMLEWWQRGKPILLREMIKIKNRPPFFVPMSKKVNELFQELRRHKQHLAILVDEYGGTAGMVTLEDIIEEIVGDIRDEYDTEEEWLVKENECVYRVDARMDLQDLAEYLETPLDSESVDTIGGFIVELLGEVPTSEHEPIEYRDLTFTILESDERRILRMRIHKNKSGPVFAKSEVS